MPSKSVLETKQAIVAQLKDKVANSVSGVVVDYKGITAEADTKLRKELREAGVEYTVVKNTLLKRAIEAPRSRVCPRFSKAQPLWLFPTRIRSLRQES